MKTMLHLYVKKCKINFCCFNNRFSAMKRENIYRPQTKFANVMFLQVCVCPQGGVRGCREVCVVVGGVRGCRRACMVVGAVHGCRGAGGHAWLQGGVWDMMRYGQ